MQKWHLVLRWTVYLRPHISVMTERGTNTMYTLLRDSYVESTGERREETNVRLLDSIYRALVCPYVDNKFCSVLRPASHVHDSESTCMVVKGLTCLQKCNRNYCTACTCDGSK